MADKPIRVFISCGDTIQGSYFEVLFHQLVDGAEPKLATDRKMLVDDRASRVSLTTDSGLAQYPSRLNDLYRQADVIVLVYSMVDRRAFESVAERYDYIAGPVRDFEPACFVLLGVVPPGWSGGMPHVVSPQEVESLCLQITASKYEIDATTNRKELDDLWAFLVRGFRTASQQSPSSTSSSSFSASSSSSSTSNTNNGGGTSSSTSQSQAAVVKEEMLVSMLASVITRRECHPALLRAMAALPLKKSEKVLKAAQKQSSKRELLFAQPSRLDSINATLLTPVFFDITISNPTKASLNWTIAEPTDKISAHSFFSITETQGTLAKGKSNTFTVCCVFFQPSEISRFLLIECPQEPGWCLPILLNLVAPLQPRDPLSYWTIDHKSISIGFRISSTLSANVYRSTLYGAVVAVKEWTVAPDTGRPPDLFYAEWDAFVKLKHPNIAQFLGGSRAPGEAFMVLEYLKHGQLGTFLHNPPPRGVIRTIDLRLKMATDLAKAMAFLHSQKILHRDLTSANVLVDSDCSVKLGNFGEAKVIISGLGIIEDHGTLDWTAPELLTPGAKFTQKSDVFSFGVILWELGSERAPARTMMDIKKGLLPGLQMDIKSRYPAFVDLLAQCTHIDPEQRPSFDEIVETLENIRSAGPNTYTPSTVVTKQSTKAEPPRYLPPADHGVPASPSPSKGAVPTSRQARGQKTLPKMELVTLPEVTLAPGLTPPSMPSNAVPFVSYTNPTPLSPRATQLTPGAPQETSTSPRQLLPLQSPPLLLSPLLPVFPSSLSNESDTRAIVMPNGQTNAPLQSSTPTKVIGSASPPLQQRAGASTSILPAPVQLAIPNRGAAPSFAIPAAVAPPPLALTPIAVALPISSPVLRMPSVAKRAANLPIANQPVSNASVPASSVLPPSTILITTPQVPPSPSSRAPLSPMTASKQTGSAPEAEEPFDPKNVPPPPPEEDPLIPTDI